MTENLLPLQLNLDELLNRIFQRVRDVIPFDDAFILVYDPETQTLRQRAESPDEWGIALGEGVLGQVAESREARLVNQPGDVAQLIAPILLEDELLGVFVVLAHRADVYTQQHLFFLCAFADQAALTLHTGRLHQALEQRYERLNEFNEQLVLRNEISRLTASGQPLDALLPRIAQKLAKLIHADVCALALWDRQQQRTRRLTAYGIDLNDYLSERRRPVDAPSLTKAIVEGEQTFIFNDAQRLYPPPTPLIEEFEAHSILAMPFSARGRPIGATFLMNLTPNRPFNQTHADQLASALDQMALALDNNQLLQDTQARLSETSLLLEIASIASTSLELDDLLTRVLRLSQTMLGVSAGAILIHDQTDNKLVLFPGAGFGFSGEILQFRFPVDDENSRITGVFGSGVGFFSNDLVNSVHESYQHLAHISGLTNLLVAPMRVQDESIGVFLVGGKRDPFTTTDLDMMQAMGSHVAAALRNAELLNTMRQRADLMSLINKISQELTATLDLPGLMRKVVRAIHQVLGYEAVHIYLVDETGTMLIAQSTATSVTEALIEENYTFPITKGFVGRAVRKRKSQLAPDIRQDPDFFWPIVSTTAFTPGSALAVLLQNRDRVLGAIEIVAFRLNAFQDSDVIALETLAAQVSTVIENARLWDQAQRRLLEQGIIHQIGQDLTSILDYTELVNAVVRHMTRALDTAVCLFIGIDVDTQQPRLEAEYRTAEIARQISPRVLGQAPEPAERELVEKVMETRRPDIFYWENVSSDVQQPQFDVLPITAQMALPMIAGDRVIGCMVWIETRNARKFSDSDIRLAQTLTTQASIAIENARLYRQAQRQAREQALLRRVSVSLSALSGVDALLLQFPREVLQAMAANNVMLSLRDDDGIFRVKGHALTTRMPHQMALGRIRSELSASWVLLKNGLMIQSSSALSPENPAQDEVSGVMDDISGVLVLAPIMQRGEAFGLIEVSRDDPRSIFDTQELSLLEALAAQGAVTIDNIGLYEREQRRLHQLEKVQTSSRLLAGQLQIDALITMIVGEAAAIFEAPAVSLMLSVSDETRYVTRATLGLSNAATLHPPLDTSEQSILKPVYVADVRTTASQNSPYPDPIRSTLTLPINKAGQHVGLLTLYSLDYVRAFSDEEIELAQLFASQVAVALENARLFDELEQRAIELAKANKLKSEFLARVSHELRTPMNSINGYSEMLLRNAYGVVNEKQGDRLERILRNGRNLLVIIDDLLDISKIDAGKMELRIGSVNLRDELNATIFALEAQASARGLYLNVNMPDDLPTVRADPMRLKQVLTNLLGNAIKFTKSGGITIQARVQEDFGRPMLWTEVIDTGIGIAPKDQLFIFDEFRQVDGSATREYGGTGLGLAITKKLVEMMGGRIWVDSELEQGSRFTFILPLTTDKAYIQTH